MRMIFLALLASFAVISAQPAHAAQAPAHTDTSRQTEGYERLYRVLVSDPDDLGARRLSQILVEVMSAQSPLHSEIEAQSPGFLKALEDAFMPLVISYQTRIRAMHEDDFLTAVAPLMSEEEAVEVAEFYESDMGQSLLRASRRNYQLEMSNEQLLSDEDFTREDAERSIAATRDSAMRDVSMAQQEAVNQYLMSNPRLLGNILALRDPMVDIRVSMDNEPMTGAEESEFMQIYTGVLGRYGY